MKKYILLSLAAVVMLFSSCSKSYLNTLPTDSISATDALSSVENIDVAMIGTYRQFSVNRYTQGETGWSYFNINSDILGGIIVRTVRSNGFFFSAYQLSAYRNQSETYREFYYPWWSIYQTIRNVNAIIVALNTIDTVGKEELANQLIGEACGLRALCYYQLSQLYAFRYDQTKVGQNTQLAVPLKIDDITSDLIARSTLEEVYTQVEKDIATSIAGFTASGSDVTSERMGLYAVKMLRARLEMTKGQFNEAIATVEDVIDNSGRSLMGADEYTKGFNNVENAEWIFGNKISKENSDYYGSFYAYMGANYSSSFIRGGAMAFDTAYFLKIDEDDSRLDLFITDTPAEVETNGTDYYYEKGFSPVSSAVVFSGTSKKYLQTSIGSSVGAGDIVIMRLAEAYYIAAEAALAVGNTVNAAKFLTLAVEPYDDNFVAATNKDELFAQLDAYKKFDMYGEGHTYEDHKRRGQIVYRNLPGTNHIPTQAILLEYGPMPGDPGAAAKVFKYMIPKSAIDKNSLLKRD